MYELELDLSIKRIGTPEVRHTLTELNPQSGDDALDALINEARSLYISRSLADRKTAIDKLWDAFERVKTIENPSPKKKRESAEKLLDSIADSELRDRISNEMNTLTEIGNNFNIRHHETYKAALPVYSYDYFFVRMSALLSLLLSQSGRLSMKDSDTSMKESSEPPTTFPF
ncbi:hypothetical protein GCM10029992_37360 [Glycomyces albus]